MLDVDKFGVYSYFKVLFCEENSLFKFYFEIKKTTNVKVNKSSFRQILSAFHVFININFLCSQI